MSQIIKSLITCYFLSEKIKLNIWFEYVNYQTSTYD